MAEGKTGVWTRRGFLRAGVIGGLLSGYVGLSVALQPTRKADELPPDAPVFDAEEMSILTAFADRICPAEGPGAPGAVALDVPRQVAEMLRYAPAAAQEEVKLALRVLESPLLGLLSGERYKPFTQLSPEGQDEVLASFRASSLPFKRAIFYALRGGVTGLYYGDERTWARVGYDGPPSRDALRAANPDLLVDYESLRGAES